jgi:hypothetical protein
MDEAIIDTMLGQVAAGDVGAARAVKAEIERLQGVEARVREWLLDTTLHYPSTSETAIHDAMDDILNGERS